MPITPVKAAELCAEIGKAGKPMAVLSPYAATAPRRKPGSMKGKIHISDDFDADDDLIADLFEGQAGLK